MISLIALPGPPPTLEAISSTLHDFFGDQLFLTADPNGVFLEGRFLLGDGAQAEGDGAVDDAEPTGSLVIARVEDSIPEETLAPAFDGAWYWPEAPATFNRQEGHLAVIVKDVAPGSALIYSFLLTRVTHLLVEGHDALGVFWEPAGLVHSPTAFRESTLAMGEKELPLRLWIRFQMVSNSDGTHSLYTQGLDALGLPEIEVRQSKRPPENIQGWAFNVAHYVLKSGKAIAHGETVGASETEFIRVYHLPSAIDEERRVLFLDLDLDEETAETRPDPA